MKSKVLALGLASTILCWLGETNTSATPGLLAVAEGTKDGKTITAQLHCVPGGSLVFTPSTWIDTSQTTNQWPGLPTVTIATTETYVLSNGSVTNVIVRYADAPPEIRWNLNVAYRRERAFSYDFTSLGWSEEEVADYLSRLPANEKPGTHVSEDAWEERSRYSLLAVGTGLCPINLPCLQFKKVPNIGARPVLIVPGIAGCYASDIENDALWINRRGQHPASLTIDPLAHVYDDLIKTLELAGYVRGENLFIANYDWRMPPGPVDGAADGFIQGITAESLADEVYEYGVDYLAYWLRRAAEMWKTKFPQASDLDTVDIISHSTGGLVVRSYQQSAAYGAEFAPGRHLPGIDNSILIAVPHQGAPKIWNPWNDNWGSDIAYSHVLSKIVARGYKTVVDGGSIDGPTAADVIDRASVLDESGQPSPKNFIHRYVPTMRSLLPTYPFIQDENGVVRDINAHPVHANHLLLDLNARLNFMLNRAETNSVIYSQAQSTISTAHERVGPVGWSGWDPISEMRSYSDRDARAGEVWHFEEETPASGDGTVPALSSYELFKDVSQVNGYSITTGDTTHTGLCSNPAVQELVLRLLGAPQPEALSTGLAKSSTKLALSLGVDPVECHIVDAAGRRLGYLDGIGVVNEIPDSLWLGGLDGIGLIYGDVALPLTVRIKGMNDVYRIGLKMQAGGRKKSAEWSGFLGHDQIRVETVELPSQPSPRIIALNQTPAATLRIAFEGFADGASAHLEVKTDIQGVWLPDPAAAYQPNKGQSFITQPPGGAGRAFYRVATKASPQ